MLDKVSDMWGVIFSVAKEEIVTGVAVSSSGDPSLYTVSSAVACRGGEAPTATFWAATIEMIFPVIHSH